VALVPLHREGEVLPGDGAAAVDVDVADAHALGRPPTQDDRHARGRQARRERIILVQAHQERAVDVAGRKVVGDARLVGGELRHEQDQLSITGRER